MPENTKRILVLDDDDTLRALICRALKHAGYSEVTEANDGREGLQLCGKNHYDLVITDIIMPEVDGMEVIFSLQKTKPDTRVIAMSGGGRIDADNYLRMARAAGTSVLQKPFELPHFLEMVARELDAPRKQR
jgi:CheY-like chemotaxis protein